MSNETNFFGGARKKRDVPPEAELEMRERTDDRFPDRTPQRLPPKRRRGTSAPLHNFTMRLTMEGAERFIRYCERNRLSYREAFDIAVDLLEQKEGA